MVCAGSMATQKSKSEGKEMCEDYPCCGTRATGHTHLGQPIRVTCKITGTKGTTRHECVAVVQQVQHRG